MSDTPDTPISERIRQATRSTTPRRCRATLGERPSWMGIDQFDPCPCDLPNGHNGDHRCEHDTKPNRSPGVVTVVEARPLGWSASKMLLIDAADEIDRLTALLAELRDRTTLPPEESAETIDNMLSNVHREVGFATATRLGFLLGRAYAQPEPSPQEPT